MGIWKESKYWCLGQVAERDNIFPNIAGERQGYADITGFFSSDGQVGKQEGRDSGIINLMTKLWFSRIRYLFT